MVMELLEKGIAYVILSMNAANVNYVPYQKPEVYERPKTIQFAFNIPPAPKLSASELELHVSSDFLDRIQKRSQNKPSNYSSKEKQQIIPKN